MSIKIKLIKNIINTSIYIGSIRGASKHGSRGALKQTHRGASSSIRVPSEKH